MCGKNCIAAATGKRTRFSRTCCSLPAGATRVADHVRPAHRTQGCGQASGSIRDHREVSRPELPMFMKYLRSFFTSKSQPDCRRSDAVPQLVSSGLRLDSAGAKSQTTIHEISTPILHDEESARMWTVRHCPPTRKLRITIRRCGC